MNDRFKFRVWDKRLNRYLGNNDPTQMLLENGNLAYLDDEGMKFYEVEQCTGLKDKNGKLIYEGDIVELTRARNQGWMLRGTRLEVKYNIDRYCGFGFDDGYALTEKCAKICIVIGNIHENADLLEINDD